METIRLSSKGQLVIPKEMRESRHLSTGTEFIVSFDGDELRLLPVPVFPRTRVEEGVGALARPGRQFIDREETDRLIADMLHSEDQASQS